MKRIYFEDLKKLHTILADQINSKHFVRRNKLVTPPSSLLAHSGPDDTDFHQKKTFSSKETFIFVNAVYSMQFKW